MAKQFSKTNQLIVQFGFDFFTSALKRKFPLSRFSRQIPEPSINCYCNEVEHKYVHESVILILFRFFLRQVVLFAQGIYAYIKKN